VTSQTKNFQIHALQAKDAAAVYALGRSAPEVGQWSEASYERLGEIGQKGWVSVDGGILNGFIVVRILSPEMEILNLVVAAGSRRRGVAAKLFASAQEEAREQNVSRVFLEVRESNSAAITFYERIGFSKMGLRADYYRDPLEDAILMEKGIL
jgi:ribosomal-protein-alanine N-acetyltransferase